MTAQQAEHERRKLIAAEHPDEPAMRDWVRAADPRRNDPAWTDPPEWLLMRRTWRDEYGEEF
jgi:hypothetical protein